MKKPNAEKFDFWMAVLYLLYIIGPLSVVIIVCVEIVDTITRSAKKEQIVAAENARKIGRKEFDCDYKEIVELAHTRNKLIYSMIEACDTKITNRIAEISNLSSSTNSHYRELVDELSHKYRRELRKAKYATEKELDKQKENITPANHIEDEDDILSIRCFCD